MKERKKQNLLKMKERKNVLKKERQKNLLKKKEKKTTCLQRVGKPDKAKRKTTDKERSKKNLLTKR